MFLVAYYVETTECPLAYHDCKAQSQKKYSRNEKTGQTQETKRRKLRKELPDMGAELGLGKSSEVERKRTRLGEVLTLRQLLTKGVGWFTITPSLTIIVALGHSLSVASTTVGCKLSM